MRLILIIITVACLCGLVTADDQQTFFVYADQQLRPPPADEATIPLCATSDSTQVVAYAGAVWGGNDLSERPDCLAWCLAAPDRLDSFLTANGYRRMLSEESP